MNRKRNRSLTFTDWIEANVRLPDSAPKPGPMRLLPYQRGIAEALDDQDTERVSVLKAARLGYTSLMTAFVAYHVVERPASVLCVLPTESDCRSYMVDDIELAFEASPKLAGKLSAPAKGGSRIDRNTLLHRLFRGGSLKVVAAKAPRNLRRHSAQILLVDECDACEVSAEGSPVGLAEKRTLAFPRRKIALGSTPLDEGTSLIARAYAESDQRVWEVPCIACSAFSEIRWGDIEWPEGRPDLAAWRCPSCKALIAERHKVKMVKRGRWHITRPDVVGHAGFKISALASLLPQAAWGKLAQEFVRVKDDPATLKPFVNTVLAELWREDEGDALDESALASKAEPFGLEAIPAAVLAITAGVDVQADRLETTLCGWDRNNICYVLAHQVLWGTTDDPQGDVWSELDGLLRQRWQHPNGGQLKIDAACIDGGDGGRMDTVLAFAAPRLRHRVFATKGAAGFARAAIQRARTKGKPLFIIGVDGLKSRLFDKLATCSTIKFSSDLLPVWFEQLTSERKIVRMARGRPVVRFERIPGKDAEGLDCTIMNYAARTALQLNLDLRERELASPVPTTPNAPTVIRSSWVERGRTW